MASLRCEGGLVDRFVALYLFNFAYPPVFHLLSAPFVLPAADPVLAGRVYVQVLTLLVSLTLYSVTRLIGGRLAGAVAVLTLLGIPSFVDVSRHYLLEPLLTLEVLLVLYFIGRYYEHASHAISGDDLGLDHCGIADEVQLLLLRRSAVRRAPGSGDLACSVDAACRGLGR